jgi:phage shock protein C
VNPRRLYRCRRDRQLAGVAAGMAEYLDLDPTLVRILWILSAFVGGFTIVLYIILAFVIPIEPATLPGPGSWHAAGPAWGAQPTPGAGMDQADAAPGSVQDPGAGAPPDIGTAGIAWHAPWHDERPDSRRGGRGGLYAGVLLIVFGAFALANTLIPGWAGIGWLGPALLVALGVALLAGSIRRAAYER